MDQLMHMAGLARLAMGVMMSVWPITLALVIVFLIALVLKSPFLDPACEYRSQYLVVFSPLLVTLFMLYSGASMRFETRSRSFDEVRPEGIVVTLLIIHFFAGLGIIFAMKRYRWFAVFAVVLEHWIVIASGLVIWCSITGDWP